MSRTINANLLTALIANDVEPFIAIDLSFDTQDLRLWSGLGDKQINNETYTGAGSILGVQGLEEASDLSAKSVTLTLSGLNDTILTRALAEHYQNRPARIYLGVEGQSATVVIFDGLMNTMSISDDGQESTISLVLESKLVRLEKASNRRYTNENHRARHSGDTFFSYVADIQDKEIVWGREKA